MKQLRILLTKIIRGRENSLLNPFIKYLCLLPFILSTVNTGYSENSVSKNYINSDGYFSKLMLAEIALTRQNFPFAIGLYLELAKEVDNDKLRANAMELAFALGLKDKVKPIITQWNKEKPNNAYAQIYLAKLYLFERKYSQALNLLNQIQTKGKLANEVTFLKGLHAFDLRMNDKAMVYFKKLLANQEYKNHAAIFIAKLYLMDGNINEAIHYYEKIKRGTLYYNAQLALMMLYVHQQKPEQSLEIVSKILPYTDNKHYRKRFLYIKGTLELVLSKNKSSVETFKKAVTEFPNDVNFYYLRGLVYMDQKNYQKAKADMQAVLDSSPNHPEALSAMGFILIENGTTYDQSLKLIKKAHKIAPKTPQVLDSLGWLMYKQGNNKEALIYLEQAYDMLPYGIVAIHYVSVLEATGQKGKAQAVIKKIQTDKENGYDIQKLMEHFRGKWND